MKKIFILWLAISIFACSLIPEFAWTDLDEPPSPPSLTGGELSGQIESLMLPHLDPMLSGMDIVSAGLMLSGDIQINDLPPQETGAISLFTGAPLLVISEVFFDGSDEWFELTNVGSGVFNGSLTIKGVKSTDLILAAVILASGESAIWGDTMSQIANKTMVKGSNMGLSISDTSAMNIGLYSSGILLDSFAIDGSIVSALPNNYGFEKVRSGLQLPIISTATGRVSNILASGSWIANPGVLRTRSPPQIVPKTPEATGSSNSGSVFTGAFSTDPVGTTGTIPGWVTIREIHPGNDALPEYIELYFKHPFVGTLSIAGLGNSTAAKTLVLNAYTGQYLVISDSLTGFLDSSPVMITSAISLTDGGESLTVTDLSGNVLDSALYSGTKSGLSRYRAASGGFESSALPTPGFSEAALGYFTIGAVSSASTISNESIKDSYYQALYKKRKDRYYDLKAQIGAFGIRVNKAGMAYASSSEKEVELLDGSEEFSPVETEPEDFTVKITALLADSDGKDDDNEKITISLLSGNRLDLNGFFIHSKSTKTPLKGTLDGAGSSQTFKATFGFTNKPSCVTLEKGDKTYDTFCYGQPKAGIWITSTGSLNATTVLSGMSDFSRMKDLNLSLLTGQACALFDEAVFDCISLSSYANEKTTTKYTKKVASLQLKFDKKQHQYTGLQERYKTMKSSLDSKRRKYYKQTKTIRSSLNQKLSFSKLETKLWKNYGQLIEKDLKSNRFTVRQASDINILSTLLTKNVAALKLNSGAKDIEINEVSFPIADLKKQYSFVTNPGALLDALIEDGLLFITPKGAKKWAERRKKRYNKDH